MSILVALKRQCFSSFQSVKKLITKAMGIHQTPTTLWVESYDGFRCIYSWLRGEYYSSACKNHEFFLASQALNHQELRTLVPKFIFQETLFGWDFLYIQWYIYIYGNGYTESQWFGTIIGTPQPHVSSESVRETEWITSLSSNKPKEFIGATVPDGENKVGIYICDGW